MASKSGKAAVKFIFVTILLDAMGLGILIPVLPGVLRRFNPDPVFVSQFFGYFMAAYAGMQFFASPVLGSLSDRFGRKPILLISLLGAALDYLFMAFAPTLPLLFLGRLISGLSGASMTVASSYIADVSNDKNRSANFGMIGAGFGLGFILGPMLGGLLSGLGPKAPFLAAALFNLLNFAFGLFVLPESLDDKHRRQVEISKLNPLSSIFKILSPSPFVMLIWCYFILFLAGQVHPINWTLYTQTKFGWTAAQVGLSLSFVGLCIALANVFLPRLLIPKLGEKGSFTFGLVVYVLGFLLFGIAGKGWMMYAIMVFFAFSGVTMPALQSIVARHAPRNRQGELQGSLISLGSLSTLIAPLIFSPLFSYFIGPKAPFYFPGAAYVLAAVICVLALVLDLLSTQKK